MSQVFMTGGTGYVGQRLIPILLERGHRVRALVRSGSERTLPNGCVAIQGNALDKSTFVNQIAPADTFIQLVGVAHPSPSKAGQFKKIDLVSGRESVAAAKETNIRHFIYVSVAQPAPMMQAYIEVRAEIESLLRMNGFNATILRPWYVLGPGHRWPYALLPLYWVWGCMPSKRDLAQRLGLITLRQMLAALVNAVENPADGIRLWEVPQMRNFDF